MSIQKNHESQADPITLNEFVNSLQRLFKIGIYYPSGHAILDKATKRFMTLLSALAGDNPSVTIQDFGSTLLVEGVEIDPNFPFVQEFRALLSTLGITALTIEREITMDELHEFVRKLIYFKSKILSAKQFSQIEVNEIPPSVTVRLKEFLARQDASISDESSGEASENISTFIESLTDYGLSREEINHCKTLIDSLPSRLSQSNVDMSELPSASWDDVARLLSRAVKSGKNTNEDIRQRVTTHTHINALASILKKLEHETHDKKSRESINLLVSIIKKPFTDAEDEIADDEDVSERVFPDQPGFSIEQLQQYTTKNRLHPKILASIPESPENNEALSILMQLAQFDQTLQTQIRTQQLFRELLSTPLSEASWTIISAGFHQIIQGGKAPRISSIAKLLVEPLRRSRHSNTLHLFFLTLQLCNASESKILWPYVVNEILVNGSSADQHSYHSLCQFAASLSFEEMYLLLPKLETLESFQANSIAPDIFHAVSPRCYPLFAFLLKTEIEQFIGDRVVGGLRRNPSDWLCQATVPLLDLSKPEHKLFLYSYLRQASQKALPASLKSVAAKIIAEMLPALPQEKRNETWVHGTIRALSQLQTVETRTLLEQIAREKKLLFIPEWPAECRKAAESALLTAKKRRS